MIKVEKERVLEVLGLNPAYLIGREILLKNYGNSAKIIDINLKCTHLKLEFPDRSTKWIGTDELENIMIFDEFDISHNCMISVKLIVDALQGNI
jgi:hypothetical protein